MHTQLWARNTPQINKSHILNAVWIFSNNSATTKKITLSNFHDRVTYKIHVIDKNVHKAYSLYRILMVAAVDAIMVIFDFKDK